MLKGKSISLQNCKVQDTKNHGTVDLFLFQHQHHFEKLSELWKFNQMNEWVWSPALWTELYLYCIAGLVFHKPIIRSLGFTHLTAYPITVRWVSDVGVKLICSFTDVKHPSLHQNWKIFLIYICYIILIFIRSQHK